MSGAATGGLLAARSGLKNMGRNAIIGGVILAAIEGFSVFVSRYVMPTIERRQMEGQMQVDKLEPPVDPMRRQPIWRPDTVFAPQDLVNAPQPSDGTITDSWKDSSPPSPNQKSGWS